MPSGILGQVSPGVSLTDLYICPPNTLATLKVIVTNRGGATTFRIEAAKNGEASDAKQRLASDTAILANDAVSSVSFMIGAGDVVRVSSATSNVSFTATGDERADK
jgi:hypothetical protein